MRGRRRSRWWDEGGGHDENAGRSRDHEKSSGEQRPGEKQGEGPGMSGSSWIASWSCWRERWCWREKKDGCERCEIWGR